MVRTWVSVLAVFLGLLLSAWTFASAPAFQNEDTAAAAAMTEAALAGALVGRAIACKADQGDIDRVQNTAIAFIRTRLTDTVQRDRAVRVFSGNLYGAIDEQFGDRPADCVEIIRTIKAR